MTSKKTVNNPVTNPGKLRPAKKSGAQMDAEVMERLLMDLQMHQVELEMQNDELRAANYQLELQQLKFEAIYDLAPIGYFILDEYGVISEVNNAGLSLLESSKEGIVKKRLQSFVGRDYSDTYYRFYRALLNTKKKQSCHLKMVSKKGREFYVQVEGIAIASIPNHPVQCDIAIIDITERVQAEQNLAKTKERLELALEASASGMWELELHTMKFYLDEFNYRMCAIPGGEFDGRYATFINMIHPDDRDIVDRHFRESANNQQEIDVVCRFINDSGSTCYASLRGHVITTAGENSRFVGIMMDITEKRKADEETYRLKHDQQQKIVLAALRAEENERKRISDALHDGVSQLLYGAKIQLDAVAGDTGLTVTAIMELLDMAIAETRNISFELAPSILSDFGLPTTVEELARRLSTPDMQIVTVIDGFNERVDLQMEMGIFRIIQELVNNCMKHSSATRVDIELGKRRLIEICVKDNGKGFNINKRENKPEGSGLSSVKNRVNLYNGNFNIISDPGAGTIVRIKLDPKQEERHKLINAL
ncbi:MAG: PAS domain S-box protein [Bacteroidota bacterium]|nr:PAS domain S-box protein [Bacteroidota bacterium]